MRAIALAIGFVVIASVAAQDLSWQIPSPPSQDWLHQVRPYVDHDGDGYRDFLLWIEFDYAMPGWTFAVQIRSGRDASVLWQIAHQWYGGMADAGDVDGDGTSELAVLIAPGGNQRGLEVWSPTTGQMLWQTSGFPFGYGYSMVGDFDVDGDGRSEFAMAQMNTGSSFLFVYNSDGTLRYSIDTLANYNGVATSVSKMPDMDGDGHDDLLLGINDASLGTVLLLSGDTGAVIRQTQGLQPGDKTCDCVSGMGDLDGDGVHDYAAFPWITAARAIVVVWSGATGQVLRTWNEFGNSVITGEDFDRDGVPDLAIGADWLISPNVYGSTRVYSGRDGAELWRVNNAPFVPAGQGSTGFYGWMEYSASLGVQPGDAYPTIAWLDADWIMVGTIAGRVRGYRASFARQGTVYGQPCSTGAQPPLIGARRQPTAPTGQNQARVTLARGHPGAAAWLMIGFPDWTIDATVPPIDLSPYGMPGCLLQVWPFTSRFTTLGTNGIDAGYGHVDLPQQFAATFGTRLVTQWLWFDPATLGYGASEVHELRLL